MEKLIKKIGNEFPVALVNFRGFHSTVFTFDHFVIMRFCVAHRSFSMDFIYGYSCLITS